MHPSELKGHMNCMSALLVRTLYTGELLSLITTLVISSCLTVRNVVDLVLNFLHKATSTLVQISSELKGHLNCMSALLMRTPHMGKISSLTPLLKSTSGEDTT